MKKTGRVTFIAPWLLLLALPLALPALEAEVKASINAERIGLDDTLIYTLTFRNISNPLQPDLSHWDDFKTLQTSRSTEFQFSNGASTSSTTFTYYLMPVRTGKLTLPPVQYSHEGRTYQTQALTVEVVKGSLNPRSPAQANQPSPLDEDFFASPFHQDRQEQPVDVRLRAVISKTNCTKGEQLLFRVLLYTRNRIEAVNMVSSPSFAGFWQEWYPVPQSISAGSENVDGVIYQVYEIRKAALFAGESGTLTIPALQFEMQLADSASMFVTARPVLRSTQPLKITVSELPATATGLPVGQFSFSASCSQRQADINDIVTLRLEISGSGNCKTIIPPALPSDEYLQVYPAKISQENGYGPLALKGTVRVEIPVAFNKAAAVTFPSLEFRYFNPESRSLVSLRSQPLVIEVSGEKLKTEKSMTLPQSAIVQKGEDIDFIKSGPIVDQARYLYRQGWYKGIIILLFAVNLLFLLKITVWRRAIVDSPLLKNRRILGLTLRRLAKVQHYEDIAAILEYYCVEKSGLGLAEISNQKIGELLGRRQVPAASIDRFLFVKGQAELAKFSPLKKSQSELKSDLLALRKLLREIDHKLK
ncbi:MAG: BatD family protein [Candidatus Aminicenantes bacterium]|nr:BatD family protein [Candidatus Aminicenantes bacterium]